MADEQIRSFQRQHRSIDTDLLMAKRQWLMSGDDTTGLNLFRRAARYGAPFTSFIPWGHIKDWIHRNLIEKDNLLSLRSGFTFDQICELTRNGYLRVDQFTTQEIIWLLEASLRAENLTPIAEKAPGRGDEQVRYLERVYRQEPTKLNLLSYAMACLRHGVTPTVDFCLASPVVEPFFDPDRDLPE